MRLIWSRPSIADLAAIDHWLTTEADRATAEAILDRIRGRARRLRDFPSTGQPLGDGCRSVTVPRSPYVILYNVAPTRVEILRIRHGREDWREGE